MALSHGEKLVIRDEHLDFREKVGEGGFGRVFKAYHKEMVKNVAVKVLWNNVSHRMFKEAMYLEKASSEFVLRLIGIYEGPPPLKAKGIVTEYMKRGSIETLQKTLRGPPPEPLAFQFVYQTALAMNFLHLRGIVHLDLKPNNILLSDMLDVKLADFGLSRETMSLVGRTNEAITGLCGTMPYIPPEAFEADNKRKKYKPVRAFDIYSFGILIWSIFTGRPPYPEERHDDIPSHICDGERPGWENDQAELLDRGTDGIKDLVDLMRKCWDQNPENRPPFRVILERHGKDDKSLFLKHSSEVMDAIATVLKELNSPNDAQQSDLQPLNPHREVKISINSLCSPTMGVKDQTEVKKVQELLDSGRIYQTELSESQCSALAHILMSGPVLEELVLSRYRTTEAGRQRLVPVVKNCRKAQFMNCSLSGLHCAVISSALRSSPHLTLLYLSYNPLGDSGVSLLCEGLKSPDCQLSDLSLMGCGLSEISCSSLASALKNNPSSRLTRLGLGGNQVSDIGVKHLSGHLETSQCKLEILVLQDCGLSEISCSSLASALKNNPSSCLTELDLLYNRLRRSDVKELLDLKQSPDCSLKTMRFS